MQLLSGLFFALECKYLNLPSRILQLNFAFQCNYTQLLSGFLQLSATKYNSFQKFRSWAQRYTTPFDSFGFEYEICFPPASLGFIPIGRHLTCGIQFVSSISQVPCASPERARSALHGLAEQGLVSLPRPWGKKYGFFGGGGQTS